MAAVIDGGNQELLRRLRETGERREAEQWAAAAVARDAAQRAREAREQAVIDRWREDRIEEIAAAITSELGACATLDVDAAVRDALTAAASVVVTAGARLARRQQHSAPLMTELGAWILEHKPNEPPKSPRGRAITYANNQWKALNRSLEDGALEDGALEIENGGAARSLRGLALGRRNWLFAGSDDGARRTAVINSAIESAVLHDLEPWLYLSDVLQKLTEESWPATSFSTTTRRCRACWDRTVA